MSSQHSYLPALEKLLANHARYGHTLNLPDVASRSKHDQRTGEEWNVQDVLEHATTVMTMVDHIDSDNPNFQQILTL